MTFIATLTIRLEVAILVGVLVSLLVYLQLDDASARHARRARPDAAAALAASARADAPLCPQLDILRIDGSLFFGSVEHVRDEIEAARVARPAARHVLLIGSGVNFIDDAGAELLAQRAAAMRHAGGALYLSNVNDKVRGVLERADRLDAIGAARIFATREAAVAAIHAELAGPAHAAAARPAESSAAAS